MNHNWNVVLYSDLLHLWVTLLLDSASLPSSIGRNLTVKVSTVRLSRSSRARTSGEDKNFNLLRTIDPKTPTLPKMAPETGFLIVAAPIELFSGYRCQFTWD